MTVRRGGVAGKGLEAFVLGALGAALGWFVGGLVHSVVGVVMAVVGGVNGALSGWRRVYAWRTGWGALAFVLDATWAALSIAVALLPHAIAFVSRKGGYESSLSERQNRHVYRRGAYFKKGFALTVGNVISSAGEVDRPSRRKLITDHEAVHVWQARGFGPLYLPCYGVWSGLGALAGVVLWLRRGRREPLGKVVESCSYYLNPFEWWAYSRDDLWPPPGKLPGLGWKQPAVRPLAQARAARAKSLAELALTDREAGVDGAD